MKNMISVIVPVYNTGVYLNKCIKSILSQDYKNFEIILVDDGSTEDETVQLCDDLATNNDFIQVIHKKNGGSSSARNIGIENAKGEYIVFIDSDDYIETNMLSSLLKKALENDVKLVIGGMIIDGYKKIVRPDSLTISTKLDVKTALHYFMLGHWHSACTNLYHRSIFENLKFAENESNEDYYLNFFAIQKAKFVYVDLNIFYHYVKREGSNTTARATLKNLDWVFHTKNIYNLILEDSYFISLKEEAEYQYIISNIILANKALLSLKNKYTREAFELYKIVSENIKISKKILKNNQYLSMKYRIMGIIISNFPVLYRQIIIYGLKMVKKNG